MATRMIVLTTTHATTAVTTVHVAGRATTVSVAAATVTTTGPPATSQHSPAPVTSPVQTILDAAKDPATAVQTAEEVVPTTASATARVAEGEVTELPSFL